MKTEAWSRLSGVPNYRLSTILSEVSLRGHNEGRTDILEIENRDGKLFADSNASLLEKPVMEEYVQHRLESF